MPISVCIDLYYHLKLNVNLIEPALKIQIVFTRPQSVMFITISGIRS